MLLKQTKSLNSWIKMLISRTLMSPNLMTKVYMVVKEQHNSI
jgi:hypothetical protein